MLFRNNSSSGEADQDIYLNMTSSSSLHTGRHDEEDVVSLPAPAHTEQSMSIYHTGHDISTTSSGMGMNDLDDVWGDDDSSSSHPAELGHQQISDRRGAGAPVQVSDIPRLKQEHTTAGYRDGVTIAKAASVQAGFDEGYGLGATIGAHAGRLLGLLTGLVGALSSSSSVASSSAHESKHDEDVLEKETARLQRLLNTATQELSVLSIFGEEFFARDGIWRYEVVKQDHPEHGTGRRRTGDDKARTSTGAVAGKNEEQKPELSTSKGETTETENDEEAIVFVDIAASHPLLRKWDGIVQQEVDRYGLVWDVLLSEEDYHEEEHEDAEPPVSAEKEKEKVNKKPAPVRQNKGALAW